MVSERTAGYVTGVPAKAELRRYYISMVTFLVSLGLLLLTVVDIRRGFLFSDYFKVGAPATLLNLDWRHLPLILIGGLGVWLGYRYMSRLEKGLKGRGISLAALARVVAIVIGVFLVADLFTYRGVPASRILEAGPMGAGPGAMGTARAIPVASFPGWFQPVVEGVNYILVTWHATMLAIVLGSLFLVAGAGIVSRLKGRGFGAHLAGSAVALAQPF